MALYSSILDLIGNTPMVELRSLSPRPGVHIYANIVTVDLAKGATTTGLDEIVRNLYRYWQPGMEPPSFDDVAAEEATGEAGGGGTADAGTDPALAEAAKRVPMHLLERSRAARERWKAKH